MKILLHVFAIFVILTFTGRFSTVYAHPLAHSMVELEIGRDRVVAHVRLPMSDFQVALKETLRGKSIDEIRQRQGVYIKYILSHVDISDLDQGVWGKEVSGALGFADMDKRIPDFLLDIVFRPSGTVPKKFNFRSDMIIEQVMTHKIFVGISTDWEGGIFSDNKKLVNILRYQVYDVEINREGGGFWTGLWGTFKLGLRHIYEGVDHLLFLLMLILPAPLIASHRRWTDYGGLRNGLHKILILVSAFTAGHSLTLLLGSLNWLQIPPSVVEPLVAFSVLVTAVHAIWPLVPNTEWIITAMFGLIHGLAFSEVVKQFDLPLSHLVLSVLSFNLGVECMQLLALMAVVPFVFLMARTKYYYLIKNAIAVAGGGMALVWIYERVSGIEILAPFFSFGG